MRFRATSAVLFLALLAGCGDGGNDRSTGTTAPTPVTQATPVPTPVPTPAPSVSGDWVSQARSWNFRLRQNGTTLSGVVLGFKKVGYPQGDPAVQITGSISTSGEVAFRAPVWGIDFTGRVAADGITMNGTLYDCANGCRNYGEILEKQ
jgi:hypothetical protein